MSLDFISSQVRTGQIVGSGSKGETLLIYSAKAASNYTGGYPGTLLSNVGNDVFLFVSGGIAQKSVANSESVSLFGGDLVSSGSLFSLNGVAELRSTATTALLRISSANRNADLTMTTGGEFAARNTYAGGRYILGATATGGGSVNFSETRMGTNNVNTKVTFMRDPYVLGGAADPFASTDTSFFVGGTASSKGGANGGTTVVGGDFVASGSVYFESNLRVSGSTYLGDGVANDYLFVKAQLASDIIPDMNVTRNLGSESLRFANIYTGDLHLKNDRGDYTLIEEEDCLTIRFNKTGKRYKFVLEPAPEFDEK